MDKKHETTYRGKKMSDMSKEELIEALELAVKMIERERSEHMRQLDVIAGLR